jgi:FAD dependent oxidoreductase
VSRQLSSQYRQAVVWGLGLPFGAIAILGLLHLSSWGTVVNDLSMVTPSDKGAKTGLDSSEFQTFAKGINGRPQLSPVPQTANVWDCEVVVVGGSLGGIAAASHAMKAGAQTCLIELSPWLGGQISAQGVSALDESSTMRQRQNFSPSWQDFKKSIEQQPVDLPDWTRLPSPLPVANVNRCWVGQLCFPPKAGAAAADQLLQGALPQSPQSRWTTSTAFKGAEFDLTGQHITAIYAVHRIPKQPGYTPLGRPSVELPLWYSWSSDETFAKVPLKLQAPAGKRMMVIDATDTSEVVGWAGVPYRIGSDAKGTFEEPHAPLRANPQCTQAFTFPFVLAIANDQGASLRALSRVQSEFALVEHLRDFDLEGFPMFRGNSLFHYRRIVSTTRNDPERGTPTAGDMTLVNWNRGNDWTWMNPPLILTDEQLRKSGQQENWMGGLSVSALKFAETHALLFARWLIETKAEPAFPLTYLAGAAAPLGTASGLSMMPYIREGRRIIGREAYGQSALMLREQDLRKDMDGGRSFQNSAIALTHYDVDMHGCRYRNWFPSWEAQSAPAKEWLVRPTQIPLEALIPQGVDNLLIGGKGIAVSHIVNASTRIHYGEWSVGAASGAIAAWLTRYYPDLTPAEIVPAQQMPKLQQYLIQQGLRFTW